MRKKKILIAPLDWGIGHATRIIPLIEELLSLNAEVIIAADNLPLRLLQSRFPQLKHIRLPGFKIRYSRNRLFFVPVLLRQIPKILAGLKNEHRQLDKIIEEEKIDAVISDNRFGLYNKTIPSVFITHQLFIRMPRGIRFLEPLIFGIQKRIWAHYSELWIPDFAGAHNLSGDLAHKKKLENTHFLGALSRFSNFRTSNPKQDLDILVILSGPEPQRSILEQKLITQLSQTAYKTVILQGKPSQPETSLPHPHIQLLPHAPDEQMAAYIQSAKHIICRSGYSSIMDMAVLNAKAIFIPTPGQTEQEYLAKYLKGKKICNFFTQEDFDIHQAIEEDATYSGFDFRDEPLHYPETIRKFLAGIAERESQAPEIKPRENEKSLKS